MPEDLKLSQIGSSPLPPPLRGLHSPGVRKLSNYLRLLFLEIVYCCCWFAQGLIYGAVNCCCEVLKASSMDQWTAGLNCWVWNSVLFHVQWWVTQWQTGLFQDEHIALEKASFSITGGCCTLVALFICGKLYIANAGDCRYHRHNLQFLNAFFLLVKMSSFFFDVMPLLGHKMNRFQ